MLHVYLSKCINSFFSFVCLFDCSLGIPFIPFIFFISFHHDQSSKFKFLNHKRRNGGCMGGGEGGEGKGERELEG